MLLSSAPAPVPDAAAAAALFAPLAGESVEGGGAAYLDKDRRLLAVRLFGDGMADRVTPPLRLIVGDALRLDAAGVVLAHNHPSGDARPSRADLALTRRLATALDVLGVRLLDHLVLVPGANSSFRALGLL